MARWRIEKVIVGLVLLSVVARWTDVYADASLTPPKKFDDLPIIKGRSTMYDSFTSLLCPVVSVYMLVALGAFAWGTFGRLKRVVLGSAVPLAHTPHAYDRVPYVILASACVVMLAADLQHDTVNAYWPTDARPVVVAAQCAMNIHRCDVDEVKQQWWLRQALACIQPWTWIRSHKVPFLPKEHNELPASALSKLTRESGAIFVRTITQQA